MHIVSADWPCPHYLKIKMPSKIKKNFNIIQHTLIDQQIADLRAQLPKKSNKNLKTILLYHGLHFSLLGCKTTTRKRTRSCILCYIQHPRDQPYYAIMSVHVHYLRKKTDKRPQFWFCFPLWDIRYECNGKILG